MKQNKFDINGLIKKLTNPQSVKDLDKFLDALPKNVGMNALAILGMTWGLAVAAIFFTSTEVEKVSKLHADLQQLEALQPPIPTLVYTPVAATELKLYTDKVQQTYKGVTIASTGEGVLTITAADTDFFPQFLATISAIQSGGKNWKTKLSTFCVGRACSGTKLSATLKIESVRLGEPDTKPVKPL